MARLKHISHLVLVLLLAAGTSCSDNSNLFDPAEPELSGSGILVSEEREAGTFTAISASGPITTVISPGQHRQVVVTADNNIIHRVKTSVYGNTLHISLMDGDYHNIWIRVQVNVPTVTALSNNGTGTMKVSGLDVVGSLKVTNVGNGAMILEGKGNELNLKNEGAGSVNAYGFMVGLCSVTNEGAGSCEVYCTELLDGTNTGSGSIRYKGAPTVTIDNTGTGGVFKEG